MAIDINLVRAAVLILLILAFLGIIAWVLWPTHSRKIEEHGRIPFKDEES